MSKLECPFCHKELDTGNYFVHCHDPHCNITAEMEGTEEMWEALIRARKALDVARNGLEYIFGYEGVPEYVAKHVRQVLDQIKSETALEQKD